MLITTRPGESYEPQTRNNGRCDRRGRGSEPPSSGTWPARGARSTELCQQTRSGPGTAKAAEAFGVKALAIQADSADPTAVVAAVERTVRELAESNSRQQCWHRSHRAIDDYRLEDFDRTFAVNVRAVFVATQAREAHDGGGARHHIGSCNAERMPSRAVAFTR